MEFSFNEPGMYRAFWRTWALEIAWGGSHRWLGAKASQSRDGERGLTLSAGIWWASVYVTIYRTAAREWVVGLWCDDMHLSAQAYRGDDEMNAHPWMFEWPWKRWIHVRCDTQDLRLSVPYRYERERGEVQETTAALKVEEREWRWMHRRNPLRIKVHRYVDVTFAEPIGEGVDSWKGGTVGCAVEMLPGEDAIAAVRRMERERRFR